jgi:hypothetical protein
LALNSLDEQWRRDCLGDGMPNAKTYLGDAVYLEVLPWGDVVLTTSNGECDTNRIVLEPSVYAALLKYAWQPLRCPRCQTPRVADSDGR